MASDSAKSKANIYETITAKILAAIESNPGEPVLPWQRGGFNPTLPINATTQAAYRGINILSLWVSALERGSAVMPRSLGWSLLTLSILGVVLMPSSGFWLAFPPAIALLVRKNARSAGALRAAT